MTVYETRYQFRLGGPGGGPAAWRYTDHADRPKWANVNEQRRTRIGAWLLRRELAKLAKLGTVRNIRTVTHD